MKKTATIITLILCSGALLLPGCSSNSPTKTDAQPTSQVASVTDAATKTDATAPDAIKDETTAEAGTTEKVTEKETEKETQAEVTKPVNGTQAKVTVDYTTQADEDDKNAIFVTVADSEFATRISIKTNRDVDNFRFLKLTPESVTENGIAYSESVLYSAKELDDEDILIFKVTFNSDIPEYGMSYYDADGTLKLFSIGQSGMDGSIVLTPFG